MRQIWMVCHSFDTRCGLITGSTQNLRRWDPRTNQHSKLFNKNVEKLRFGTFLGECMGRHIIHRKKNSAVNIFSGYKARKGIILNVSSIKLLTKRNYMSLNIFIFHWSSHLLCLFYRYIWIKKNVIVKLFNKINYRIFNQINPDRQQQSISFVNNSHHRIFYPTIHKRVHKSLAIRKI